MKFDNSYLSLGEKFFRRNKPEKAPCASLFLWNQSLADELGFDPEQQLSIQQRADIFSGNEYLDGSEPVALAYAGHQFGNFVAQLGDGRAHLLGEVIDTLGNRKDIQLKGSGTTDFSRNGDGRYAMGPAIREYLMSEFMHALGIPTARSLCVCETGETVYREQPQPGAVLTRIAASHIRVGTFEYLAARGYHAEIASLADHVIQRHYPHITATGPERLLELLSAVMGKQIALVVEWLRVGFIHGVMNTDNTTISGETIDFGPCAMINHYDPETVFSSIDRQARYAFGNQPTIISWNMARLAETFLPLIDQNEKRAIDKASDIIAGFGTQFSQQYFNMMARKLGIKECQEDDQKLISELLEIMQQNRLDYTITFDRLTRFLNNKVRIDQKLTDWLSNWQNRLQQQNLSTSEVQQLMRRHNPMVIARNHHMEQVLAECLQSGSADAAEEFLRVLRSPYSETRHTLNYQDAPLDGDIHYKTFCGT